MQWIPLISAFGIGALITKLLDVVWLQRLIASQQHQAWLRNQRLESFTEVVREFTSFGLHSKGELKSPFESYAAISKALLLIPDPALIKRIDHFVVDLYELNGYIDAGNNALSAPVYKKLVAESRELTAELRRIILE